MKLGYIGLGKMGFNMIERLVEKGHFVVANNRSSEPVDRAIKIGAEGAYSISELVEKLDLAEGKNENGKSEEVKNEDQKNSNSRTIWIMVTHTAVDNVLNELVPLLNEGDTIIDGGNSPYLETVRRAKELGDKGIRFMDVGVSGGPAGARNGACLMIGGDRAIFEEYKKLFADISAEESFGYMGRHGAGHFVKMVHNGIEYGMMQAIGEGFEVMKKAEEFELDLPEIARVYNNGSVIESRLVGWLSSAFKKHGVDLDSISGEVSHSGEGQWTVEAAERLGVPVEIIKGALDFRKNSQGNPSYTGKVVSALRNEFGGHDVSEKS